MSRARHPYSGSRHAILDTMLRALGLPFPSCSCYSVLPVSYHEMMDSTILHAIVLFCLNHHPSCSSLPVLAIPSNPGLTQGVVFTWMGFCLTCPRMIVSRPVHHEIHTRSHVHILTLCHVVISGLGAIMLGVAPIRVSLQVERMCKLGLCQCLDVQEKVYEDYG